MILLKNSQALSLLLDHALLIHPERPAKRLPAFTAGSLKQAALADSLLAFVRQIVNAVDPANILEQLADKFKQLFPLVSSGKHMTGRDLGRQEPTPSLLRRAVSTQNDHSRFAMA
jgi:hypothetical protein